MIFRNKKERQIKQLEKKYQKLIKEAFELSRIDRKESDKKMFDAEQVQRQLESL